MIHEFTNWKNQYIDLIETKPHCIVRLRKPDDSAVVKELIQTKAAGREICCELGCGSGGHLIQLAERHPNKFFVGFELRFKRVFRTAEKGELLKLDNFLIIQGDARKLSEIFSDSSLSVVYVNFPDPWEKIRWRKHRLLSKESLCMIFRLLKTGGVLSYKSDHKDYFNETVKLVEEFKGIELSEKYDDLYSSARLKDNIPSEFEKLFHAQGLPIFFLEAKKLDGFQS